MAVTDANPYIIASIGAGSALIGVLLASLVQVLTARGVRKAQREALETQAAHATQHALREERRRAYAEFLGCANASIAKATWYRGLGAESDVRPQRMDLPQAAWELETKLDIVRILSSPAVADAAKILCDHVAADLKCAGTGKDKPKAPEGMWSNLFLAMQADIGSLNPPPAPPSLRT